MKIDCTIISPNCRPRTHPVDTITIHCMAGDLTVEQCGRMFANPETEASSNYGIDSKGRIGLYVPEDYRSWCSSNRDNDDRAITIEVANNGGPPDWPVSEKAYAALIELLVDVCRRHGIPKLLWKNDPYLIGHVWEQNMTLHRWFAAKACPGEYLYRRHYDIAARVNERLEEDAMTGEQILQALSDKDAYELLQKAQRHAATLTAPMWARKELNKAVEDGLTDGSRPQALVTRAEAAIMAERAAKT